MIPRRLITNATIVTPRGVITDSALIIEKGRIAAIGPNESLADSFAGDLEVVDVEGAYVMPGLIDLHTDTLEKEITPRPSADFPIDVAVQELDRKMIACGITTVYHSLHFGYEEAELSNRSRYSRRDVLEGVRAMAGRHTLARTRIHARYEVVGMGPQSLPIVQAALADGFIDLLSFMDHTPGQGQYTRGLFIERQAKQGIGEEEALRRLAEKQGRPRLSPEEMQEVATMALNLGIPIASHDDDTEEKVRQMHALGVTICEFPINLHSARIARELGMEVLGGASNVLRGGSLTGNLNVTDAIKDGSVNGLCSDYYPPAMLHAVFKLWNSQVQPLHEAVASATLVPARAAGIGRETGSLEVGKDADLIVVRLRDRTPYVTQTYVRGERVHTAGRELQPQPAVALA
jgi:alpha-D-ribose 1-methylphosphonate 5-triphosphate diphosphatase